MKTEEGIVDKTTKATESESINDPIDFVYCKESGVVLASAKKWEFDQPIEFQWMPGGITTINAHYNGRPIELTVQADASTAKAVQASYEDWLRIRPKQTPFGCVEHREEEAAIRLPKDVAAFTWNAGDSERDAGIYCTAVPTELGAKNVNGRIHSSWSPSFTTDAEYSKAKEVGGRLVFAKGARGSKENPARVTGCAFSVGSLTNKPAFRNISPVKAKEGEVIEGDEEHERGVEAVGSSEGAKKGWSVRYHAHRNMADAITDAANRFDEASHPHEHLAASMMYKAAADAHSEASMHANGSEEREYHNRMHSVHMEDYYGHRTAYQDELTKRTKKADAAFHKSSESESNDLDTIYAKANAKPEGIDEIYARIAEPEDPLQSIYDRVNSGENTQPAECN